LLESGVYDVPNINRRNRHDRSALLLASEGDHEVCVCVCIGAPSCSVVTTPSSHTRRSCDCSSASARRPLTWSPPPGTPSSGPSASASPPPTRAGPPGPPRPWPPWATGYRSARLYQSPCRCWRVVGGEWPSSFVELACRPARLTSCWPWQLNAQGGAAPRVGGAHRRGDGGPVLR
jgi:hypothetical protein